LCVRRRSSLVYQLGQMVFYLLVYAGLALAQFTVGERWLRSLGKRQWIVRPILSVMHSSLGYAILLGVGMLLSVIVHGDYRVGILGAHSYLVPVSGALLALFLPWLPLLWCRSKVEL